MDVIHEQQGGNRMNQQEFDETNEVVIGAGASRQVVDREVV